MLEEDAVKDIITSSLSFLVKAKRVDIYSFVIMSNHLHIIWRIKNGHKQSDVQRDFLRFTGQKIKFYLLDNNKNELLEKLEVNHHNRQYRIRLPKSLSVELWTKEVFLQKLKYIHDNPVKAGLCKLPEEYKYSSTSFYEIGIKNWNFLTHYND